MPQKAQYDSRNTTTTSDELRRTKNRKPERQKDKNKETRNDKKTKREIEGMTKRQNDYKGGIPKNKKEILNGIFH